VPYDFVLGFTRLQHLEAVAPSPCLLTSQIQVQGSELDARLDFCPVVPFVEVCDGDQIWAAPCCGHVDVQLVSHDPIAHVIDTEPGLMADCHFVLRPGGTAEKERDCESRHTLEAG